ncbi:DUF2283 domain-containing protein [Mesorhizobium sp. M00.F.Ca.ET.186.01.1.1]|nr:DUF2283 domain-containing protein [Mesorhizobium sp. M00.F.Ca.ET.186.01.1.1]
MVMAYIGIEDVQKYVDGLKNWLLEGESPAKECLVIRFINDVTDNFIIDKEMIDKTLFLQSRNGNVVLKFDSTGQLISIEIV